MGYGLGTHDSHKIYPQVSGDKLSEKKGGVIMLALLGTVDSNLTSALSSITTYFSDNIGAVVTAVVGVALLIWLLRIAFRSFGVRRPSSVD